MQWMPYGSKEAEYFLSKKNCTKQTLPSINEIRDNATSNMHVTRFYIDLFYS